MSTRNTTTPASAPRESDLREAALRHLARYAATEARLLAVLHRRVDRWQRAARTASPEDDGLAAGAAAARAAARRVVAALAAQGVVNDAAYTENRVRTLRRAGRSGAAIAQHLAARGIAIPAARAAAGQDEAAELAAALLLARKRRFGAFAETADPNPDPAARRRMLGAFARAGFSHATAARALSLPREDAEALILAMRQG